MSQHTVYCVKLRKELPGLDEPPFDTELGKKIYDNVSQEAWRLWMEHCKMLLNEYRLNPARKEDQQVIVQQLEQFFFGEGAQLPRSTYLLLPDVRPALGTNGVNDLQLHLPPLREPNSSFIHLSETFLKFRSCRVKYKKGFLSLRLEIAALQGGTSVIGLGSEQVRRACGDSL